MSYSVRKHDMRRMFSQKYLIIAASVVLVVFVVVGLLWAGLWFADYQNKGLIVEGVVVGSVPVGGLTKSQAYEAVELAVDAFEKKGLLFEAGDQSVVLMPQVISQAGPDYSYSFFEFDIQKSVDEAYGVTRYGGLLSRAAARLAVARDKLVIPMVVELDEDSVVEYLEDHFFEQETKMVEVGFDVSFDDEVKVEILPGSPGYEFLYERGIGVALQRMKRLESGSVVLQKSLLNPLIQYDEARALIPRLKELLVFEDLRFTLKEDVWVVSRDTFSRWIGMSSEGGSVTGGEVGDAFLALNGDGVNAYLDTLVEDIEVEAQSAKFEVGEDGRVAVFEASHDGLAIDREQVLADLDDVFLQNGLNELTIAVKVAEPEISTSQVNDFGIQEMVAEGRTNFWGSPANRRHNIARGVSLINGQLIKPGDEFSTIGALGDISEVNGFRAELVIKGDETKPETGGGLCQVSTTLFRATLNAGLPITMRRNHSYRVSYYEPPVGKDATIYDPWPDYRFQNDTGNYILVKGWVEGNEVVFQFWGKKDGRIQVQTEPVVYNYKEPPEPKHMLTTDLEPGEKKCTEHAHAGASAHFDYQVTYPDGEVKEERFSSVYRPWGEVCLIGATEEEIIEQEALRQLEEEQNLLNGVVEE